MKYIIIGSGGVGAYYGAKLLSSKCDVLFVGRNTPHLHALQTKGLRLEHPTFSFNNKINAISFDCLETNIIQEYDGIIIATKANATLGLAQELSKKIDQTKPYPYIISLQNGVENEKILCQYFDTKKIIGGLTRKIGAHIIEAGYIEATGEVETIIGALEENDANKAFLLEFKNDLLHAQIKCEISNHIKLELWKKLIINNGVNGLCALLKIKTGTLMNDEKLSKIVYSLMCETALAAKDDDVMISINDIDEMFELIKKFDSIKPSMLVDVENNRTIELDEICNVVIRKCNNQAIIAPYTQMLATLLEFNYSHK